MAAIITGLSKIRKFHPVNIILTATAVKFVQHVKKCKFTWSEKNKRGPVQNQL